MKVGTTRRKKNFPFNFLIQIIEKKKSVYNLHAPNNASDKKAHMVKISERIGTETSMILSTITKLGIHLELLDLGYK